MAYTTVNFRSKKALREALESGQTVTVFQPGPFGPGVKDGTAFLEGPALSGSAQVVRAGRSS